MKITTIISYLFIYVLLSCSSDNKGKNNIKDPILEKMDTIHINFYPSSGGEAEHCISLVDSVLKIESIGSLENREFISHEKKLSNEELQTIHQLTKNISIRKNIETEIILDSWRIELFINNILYYNESGVNLINCPDDIKELINFLTEISSVKIELRGFT